jgi:L-threonylcarbamoyladenylate synthase
MPFPADELITTDIALAVARLRDGGVVAIPTETVYGLAADAERPAAVARIYEIKGRPTDHPLIVHIAGLDAIDGWAAELSRDAHTLASTCWPGPLTMLVARGPRASDAVTGGRPTVGLRAPSHPVAHELLVRFGGGLAAPSANRFGKVSPTTAQHVLDDIGHLLVPGRDLVLDGGSCDVGVESTIVDLTVTPPQVLRAGAITSADVERLLDTPLADVAGPSRASGMLEAHYEPDCRVVLAGSAAEAHALATDLRLNGLATGVLDRTDDPVDMARRLYDDLRQADRDRMDTLIVVLPDATGIGAAIRDRLNKAAAADPPGPSRAD